MKTVKAFHNSAAAFRAAACACAFACGIAFADAPATATWTGGGDRNVLTDPANWQCRDSAGNVMEGAIPDVSATTVSVTGATTFNFPAGQTAIWKSLTVSGTVTLAADCDWRGAGSMFSYVAANSTLNLKGHNLYVAVPNGSANRKITVTDDLQQRRRLEQRQSELVRRDGKSRQGRKGFVPYRGLPRCKKL